MDQDNASAPHRRRLILLRHAKSAWATDAPSDHARPLNPRGQRDAPRVAEHLLSVGWTPDVVFASDAQRTLQTWAAMAGAFPEVPATFSRALYQAGVGDIHRVVSELTADVGTALLLGHNPGWEDAVGWLTGDTARMTTCNAALMTCDALSWADAIQGQWRLVQLVRPKDL